MAVMSESALSAASLLDDGAASDEVGPWVAVLGPDADRAAHHLRPGDDGRLVLRAVGPGRAPSVGRSGDRRVIFDGQLHNAHDLARALAAPAGTPAADLVARAHDRWGDASLQRLKGTFACAIWMAATGTLKLVRDPVGTYPFFFAESGGRIAFGVDAEPLLSLPWVSRALNRAAIADHLSHRWLSWHETHYQDLSRVPAGFVVTWQGGARRFERYWYPVDPSGKRRMGPRRRARSIPGGLRASDRAVPWPGSGGYLPQRRIRLGQHRRDRRELSRRRGNASPHRGVALLPGSVVQRGAHSARRRRSSLGFPHVSRPARRGAGIGRADSGRRRDQSHLRDADDERLASGLPCAGRSGARGRRAGDDDGRGRRRVADGRPRVHGGSPSAIRCRRASIGCLGRSCGRTTPAGRLLLYNMLWRFGGRLLLASWGRDLLRHAAPRHLFAHRLSQLEARSPAWVSPAPDLQRELRDRMERWTAESLEDTGTEWAFRLLSVDAAQPDSFTRCARWTARRCSRVAGATASANCSPIGIRI